MGLRSERHPDGLACIGDPRAVGPLIPMLGDSWKSVRTAAIDALVMLGPCARDELVKAQDSPDARVREGASLDISAFRARFAQAAAHEATDPQFRAFGMRSRAARCDRRAFCSKIVEEPAVWDTISLVRLACTSLHGSAAQ